MDKSLSESEQSNDDLDYCYKLHRELINFASDEKRLVMENLEMNNKNGETKSDHSPLG